MAKNPLATDAPAASAEDIAAELAESNDVVLEDAAPSGGQQQRTERDDDDRDARLPKDVEYESDPRDALVAKFAERRKTEGRELKPDYEAEAEADEADEEDGDDDPEVAFVRGPTSRHDHKLPGEEDEPAAQPARRTLEASDDDIVIVKVDGVNVEMTLGELKANAQKNAASDNRLEQLNAALDEVRALRAGNPAPAAQPGNDQARPGERTVGPTDGSRAAQPGQTNAELRKRVAAAVDKIQTEDPDTAGEALVEAVSELVTSLRGQDVSVDTIRKEISDQARESQLNQRVTAEVGEALEAVRAEYADVLDDRDYASMAFDRVVATAATELKAIGVPEEDFKSLADKCRADGTSFSMALMKEYGQLRQDPQWTDKLKPISDVFKAGAKEVHDKVFAGRPARKDTSEAPAGGNGTGRVVVRSTERSDRKRTVMTQPRSGSSRAQHGSEAPALTPGKRRKNAVQSMMQDRKGVSIGTA